MITTGDLFVVEKCFDRSWYGMVFRAKAVVGDAVVAEVILTDGWLKVGHKFQFRMHEMRLRKVDQTFVDALEPEEWELQ